MEKGVINILSKIPHYKHLGLDCDKYMSLDETVKCVVLKLKRTLQSLANSGVHEGEFNRLTSGQIYKTFSLPKAFYNCELWNN